MYIVAICSSIWLVRFYAEPRTPVVIQLLVAFSWALGFSFFLVLPFDIAGAFCQVCEKVATKANSHPMPSIVGDPLPPSPPFSLSGSGDCAC